MALVDKMTKKLTKWLSRDRAPLRIPICDFDRIQYEIRPCDVLLIEGRSRISEVIKVITQSPWSHSALYIGRLHDIENPVLRQRVADNCQCESDTQLVIEGMLGQGTIISPLTSYRRDHIRICRPIGISRHDAQRVIGYTIGRLGVEYDVRQILDLARFLFPWSFLPRRWRSTLFSHHAGTPTKQICSTLLAEAFGSVKFPILPVIKKDKNQSMRLFQRNPRLATPNDFDYSPYFEIIKYPIFELASRPIYRDLPWDDGAHVNDEDDADSSKPADTNQNIDNGSEQKSVAS